MQSASRGIDPASRCKAALNTLNGVVRLESEEVKYSKKRCKSGHISLLDLPISCKNMLLMAKKPTQYLGERRLIG
jgi:hypothetical protein